MTIEPPRRWGARLTVETVMSGVALTAIMSTRRLEIPKHGGFCPRVSAMVSVRHRKAAENPFCYEMVSPAAQTLPFLGLMSEYGNGRPCSSPGDLPVVRPPRQRCKPRRMRLASLFWAYTAIQDNLPRTHLPRGCLVGYPHPHVASRKLGVFNTTGLPTFNV